MLGRRVEVDQRIPGITFTRSTFDTIKITLINTVEAGYNVITLGQIKSDNINRMITTGDIYLVVKLICPIFQPSGFKLRKLLGA